MSKIQLPLQPKGVA